MASIFTKIINKELPGYIIDENQDFIAFLDINPLTMGHSLIVPKKEIDHFFNFLTHHLGQKLNKILIHSFTNGVFCRLFAVFLSFFCKQYIPNAKLVFF